MDYAFIGLHAAPKYCYTANGLILLIELSPRLISTLEAIIMTAQLAFTGSWLARLKRSILVNVQQRLAYFDTE